MVRRFAVLATFILAGCSGLKDAVSAHQDVVARAAGQSLTVEQLAAMLSAAKQVPLRRDVVDRVADLWVNYQLLGHATATGDSLLDSATVWAANWPQVAQRLANHLHDAEVLSRAQVTAGQADSAYNAGDVRWIDHILIAAKSSSPATATAAAQRQAAAILAQLKGGAAFAPLARQKSNDTVSARAGGSLGLVMRGQLDRGFEQAAWALKPGAYSDVVQTPYGYHIIWRPRFEQVKDSFTARLRDVFAMRLDSVFLDSLNKQADIRVRSSAPAGVRAAAQNLRDAKQSSRVLATYKGGTLTEADMARWMQAFNPQTIMMIGQAADSTLTTFVKSIARNALLIQTARERHIQLTAGDRDSILSPFRADLGEMIQRLGVAPESLAADTAVRRDRADGIARRVDAYFGDIIANSPRHSFFDVQPFLADVLRGRYQWSVSPVGVDRAVARATQLRGPSAPAPSQPAATAPAPGGPPMSEQPQAPQPRAAAPRRPRKGS